MDNAQRSNRFEVAAMALREDYDDDVRLVLIALLADARHWCDHHEYSFAEFDRQAYQHYLVDLSEQRGSSA